MEYTSLELKSQSRLVTSKHGYAVYLPRPWWRSSGTRCPRGDNYWEHIRWWTLTKNLPGEWRNSVRYTACCGIKWWWPRRLRNLSEACWRIPKMLPRDSNIKKMAPFLGANNWLMLQRVAPPHVIHRLVGALQDLYLRMYHFQPPTCCCLHTLATHRRSTTNPLYHHWTSLKCHYTDSLKDF